MVMQMRATADSVVLQSWRKPATLFTGFNTLQFGSVTALAVLVLLLVFMTETSPHHGGISTDLPKVLHPVSMPGAAREDAVKVNIMRDGKVYFENEQIILSNLPEKIADRLQDPDVERKVCVVADMRARWGTIKLVLGAIRAAGLGEWRFWSISADHRSHSAIERRPLIPRTIFDPDWCAQKSERGADLVFQKSLIREVEFDGAVGEEHERRRSNGRLSHVENFHPISHWDRRPIEIDLLKEPVHLRGGDTFAPFGGDFREQREDLLRSFAALCRDEDDRSVGQELEFVT